jgi:uncharacterized membrane protein YgdD (TMEM256/DUF423 family)
MIRAFAAFSAALAIAAGAFAAHGASAEAADWLRTGALYQLVHAVAALVVLERDRKPALLMLVGAAVFSATLYCMALGAPRWFGAITPIGGLMMIAAWLLIGISSLRRLPHQK